ncbi:MAG TPA: ferrous iron transport protein A [Campylobacterales bacterium]|nr:ferrous iron transport protein A [Campylobacterales bacterium]
MNLSELRKGDKGEIIKINAGKNLKTRFFSFGIYKGARFEIMACSLARNTMEIKVGNSMVALRRGEVEKLEVEKDEV